METSYGDMTDEELVASLDATHVEIMLTRNRQLLNLAKLEELGAWKDSGARDMPDWISTRYRVSRSEAKDMLSIGRELRAISYGDSLETGM